jgi:transposase
MEQRKFTRKFKLEAVRLIKERGVSVAQASRELDVHQTVLRNWVKDFGSDPVSVFPGDGQLKPDQLEIARLRKEVAKLKAERDILKKPRATLRRTSCEVRLDCKATGDMAGIVDLRGARGRAQRVLCLGPPVRLQLVPIATRRSASGTGRAMSPASATMVPGVFGTTCWLRATNVACTRSSD